MSATIVMEATVTTAIESPPVESKLAAHIEVEFAKCDCCGLTEECTLEYIERVRERYQGKWICGLCSEAVKEEIVRSERLIGVDEALNLHMNFCKNFPLLPPNPTMHLISAIRQILRRSFDSPRSLKSTPNSPTNNEKKPVILIQSESCRPAVSLVDSSSYHGIGNCNDE